MENGKEDKLIGHIDTACKFTEYIRLKKKTMMKIVYFKASVFEKNNFSKKKQWISSLKTMRKKGPKPPNKGNRKL